MHSSQAQQLIQDVNYAIDNWNEYNQFELKGVTNLSRSDLDDLILYAETYLQTGRFYGLSEPLGDLAAVLRAYDFQISRISLF